MTDLTPLAHHACLTEIERLAHRSRAGRRRWGPRRLLRALLAGTAIL